MKIQGLDGREYSWSLTGYAPKPVCSIVHERCRTLLKELFPTDQILEEVVLPGTGKPGLRGDFYLPLRRLMVEPGGKQHEQFVRYFHKNQANFYKGKKRDNAKEEWCEINGIKLIVLSDEETIDEWRKRIID